MNKFVTIIPAMGDNYIYLIRWNDNAAVVDPAVAAPVKEILDLEEITLKQILITHHHFDHVGGNIELKDLTGCSIIGPDDNRIPGLDHTVQEGDILEVGPFRFNIFAVPGHTSTHIAFYEPTEKWLFSGDSLFCGGCGRLFEGTPEQMHRSLEKLVKLPLDTLVYCGHEYTLNNLKFALSLESENEEVKRRYNEVSQMREKGTPSIPSTLEEEIATNPFLRVGDTKLRNALNMSGATDTEVFARIRQLKDNFCD